MHAGRALNGPRRGVAEQRKSADDAPWCAACAQDQAESPPPPPALARPRAPSNLSQSKASPSGTHREPLGEQEPAAGDTPAHGRSPRGTPREEPAGDQRHEQGSQHELQLTLGGFPVPGRSPARQQHQRPRAPLWALPSPPGGISGVTTT